MRKTITFVTGNEYKFLLAKRALAIFPSLLLERRTIDFPEIQSCLNEEIAAYSARNISNLLQTPVIVSDAGFAIHALNGFPGPFIKYINDWLTPEDILAMMEGKTDRRAKFVDILAYAEPGQEPVLFHDEASGVIAYKSSATSKSPDLGMINRIWIPDGSKKTSSEMPHEELLAIWKNKKWNDLATHILSKDFF